MTLSTDWTAIPAFDINLKMIFRLTNRAFVGLLLCRSFSLLDLSLQAECLLGRDPRFIQLNVDFTLDLVKTAVVLNIIPDAFKP